MILSGGIYWSVEDRVAIRGLLFEEVEEWVKKEGEPSFRAEQLFRWLHQKGSLRMGEITTLPLSLREKWSRSLRLSSLHLIRSQREADETVKLLLGLEDGGRIESVIIPSSKRVSLCLSTQLGCAMECSFCATGKGGFQRNLTAAEILEQLVWAEAELSEGSVTNILLMGMGEPLANLEHVLRALRIFNHPLGKNISQRRMVLSTCGLVPPLERLSQERLQIVLAVSLHAPNNELRDQLVPVNRKYPLEKLIPACRRYFERTGRRITFEYTMIDGINDDPGLVWELAEILEGLNCHLNLIPYNPVAGDSFTPPAPKRIDYFIDILREKGFSVTLRRRRGSEIRAACGQLGGKD